MCVYICVLSRFSCVRLFATLWTVARQASLSKGFSRQGCWSGLPCPPPGELPDTGIEPASLTSPDWQVGSLPLAPPGKPVYTCVCVYCVSPYINIQYIHTPHLPKSVIC